MTEWELDSNRAALVPASQNSTHVWILSLPEESGMKDGPCLLYPLPLCATVGGGEGGHWTCNLGDFTPALPAFCSCAGASAFQSLQVRLILSC